MAYSKFPQHASIAVKPFTAHVSDEALNDFKALLRLSKIGPETFENRVSDLKDVRGWGITRDWLSDAKQHWQTKYDWRATEARINSHPNFTASIDHDGYGFEVHFVALFSEQRDAIPLLLLHGWPGSFLEFLGVLDELKSKYTPATLPFHVIVPSLPGYAYTNGPPLDKNFNTEGAAAVIDKLMIGLGFGNGYIAQGGDIGSFTSRILGVTSEACKAVHLNFCIGANDSKNTPSSTLKTEEQEGLQRASDFNTFGSAYAREHGTRPSTIGLVLSSSPIALLGWIGEKFLHWTDVSPPLDEILDSVSLYWFTDSFPRSIYPYRQLFGAKPTSFHNDPAYKISKPTGYSWHPKELAPIPKAWVERTCNLVWYRGHDKGGHFAAMEIPAIFAKDMEDFAAAVWPDVRSKSVL